MEWSERLRRLPAWDTALYARLALAAFEASPEFIEQRREWRRQHPADPRPEHAIASLELFALCPCAEHAQRPQGWRKARKQRTPRFDSVGHGRGLIHGYLLAVWEATGQESPYDLLHTLADPTPEDHRRMVVAVSRELIDWALGISDPVRERANGRGGSIERAQLNTTRKAPREGRLSTSRRSCSMGIVVMRTRQQGLGALSAFRRLVLPNLDASLAGRLWIVEDDRVRVHGAALGP
ncbi:MAG: hypothetical protein M9894_24390 [Planctomycetes bacterium]|nr:hypothetical protein [Planctomycetota bacterium]